MSADELYCRDCLRATSSLEAELRVFRTGRCAYCGGRLGEAQNDEKGEPEGSPLSLSTTTRKF